MKFNTVMTLVTITGVVLLLGAALLGVIAAMAAPAAAGPLTFNTALPVSQGEGIIRGDALILRGSSGFMDEDLTGVAFPFVLGYGLTRDLTLLAMAPVFIHKSVNVATAMGRISRGSNGLGDMLFVGRYTLVEVDHPGSTFRIAPFVGFQAPTGHYPGSKTCRLISASLKPA